MCGCALVAPAPWPPRPQHALPVPEYRLALRMGSVPTPRGGMQAGFQWCRGLLCGDWIETVKFSLPERLHSTVTLKSERRLISVRAGVITFCFSFLNNAA